MLYFCARRFGPALLNVQPAGMQAALYKLVIEVVESSNRNGSKFMSRRANVLSSKPSGHYRIALGISFVAHCICNNQAPVKGIRRIARLSAHAFEFRRNHDPLVTASACFRIAGLARAKSVPLRNSQVSSRLR